MRFADRARHPSVTDYKVSVNLTFQEVKCIELIYLESRKRAGEVRRVEVTTSSLQAPSVRQWVWRVSGVH